MGTGETARAEAALTMASGQEHGCSTRRFADQAVVPWRNGGGSTREVAVDPPSATAQGGFRWRVSVASLRVDGPFSCFPGVDRRLWLVRGAGFDLDLGGRRVALREPWQRVDFAGEVAVHARLCGGPTEDLNVMTDRASVRAATDLVEIAAGQAWRADLPAGQHLLLVLQGAVSLECGCRLRAGDAVRRDGQGSLGVLAEDAGAFLLATFVPTGGGTGATGSGGGR